MLYIRADGNSTIGTGHIMRCLAIAEAVKTLGESVTFIVADDNMSDVLAERGYQVVTLQSVWNNLNEEIEKLTSVIRALSIKLLLIDSYYVAHEYLQKIRDLTSVVYIDDLNAFHYPCDMLINYNYFADMLDYHTRYDGTSLLLGCQYAPLRQEFQNLPKKVFSQTVESVLITTGGIDPYNTAGKLLVKVKESQVLGHLELHVIVGRFNRQIEGLLSLERRFDSVFLHRDVKSISRLMLDCDIAVSAGGSTLYELCACGTPTVTFALADNQVDGVNSLGDGVMISAGDIRENEDLCLDRILAGLSSLISDFGLRCDMAERMQKLVDSQGAMRIAKSILEVVD